jgi:hypothetical protein
MGEAALDRYSDEDFLWCCKEYGCEETLRREKRDGLIRIDFRNTPPPDSVTYEKWSYSRNEKRRRTSFYLQAKGEKVVAVIVAYVYEDYESARLSFMDGLGTSRYPSPWIVCDKKIGTICAMDEFDVPTKGISFAYKNVYISIGGSAEPMAEWLSGVLKKHPLTPMLPPSPLVRAKARYPAPETGYWKPWLLTSVSPEDAVKINVLFPLRYRKGETLPDLGFASPVREHLLWFWVGDDYAETDNSQAIAELGKQAVQRYVEEQENLRSQ